jgi:DNA-directed RNA polymerase subunit H (RpoH/RPB5)
MDFETIDVLYRSRQTLLSILKAKGYNTKPYEKFGPFEIETMVSGDKEVSLRMDLERKLPEGSTAPAFCRVEYALPRVKNRLNGFLTKLTETEDGEQAIDPTTTEVIVITLEAIGDTFHAAALNLFTTKSLRICFYDAHTLLSNPIEHVLVPLHEYVPPDEHAELLKKHYIKSKLNLPMIRFHQDIIGRILGIVPGDIVKITRASPSAGEYVFYRVCVP